MLFTAGRLGLVPLGRNIVSLTGSPACLPTTLRARPSWNEYLSLSGNQCFLGVVNGYVDQVANEQNIGSHLPENIYFLGVVNRPQIGVAYT